jgi:hypothetical protein
VQKKRKKEYLMEAQLFILLDNSNLAIQLGKLEYQDQMAIFFPEIKLR